MVGIVGDGEDVFATLHHAATTLDALRVPYERRFLSAHHDPDGLRAYAEGAWGRGVRVIVAGEKGAAHLAGMIKSFAGAVRVLAVLLTTEELRGLDSVASVLAMPAKVPVAGPGFDKAGAVNAGVFAADEVADRPEIAAAPAEDRRRYAEEVRAARLP